MKIDSYSFGRITINGSTYASDVIIFPERILSPWWRKKGHSLHIDDLREVLVEKPQLLIVGIGYYGLMQVTESLVHQLEQMGIDSQVARTTESVKRYNEHEGGNVVAALHLTC